MEFVHRPFQPGETIAAIATAPGEGGISIIRISGNGAIAAAEKIFSGPVQSYQSHTAHFGIIRDLVGNRIDEGLLLIMRAPRSYTGEDTVELQCHGGMIASRKVLEAVLSTGVRPASAGEFTFKAFMNGRLDLSQAEAVQKLIGAKNDQAFEQAEKHLEGDLSRKIEGFQTELIRIAAILEAWVDFPEEGIEFSSIETVITEICLLKSHMEALLHTFDDGKRMHHGISLCIAGAPNGGKSSLMNALLDQERAIVTPIAGTTRDLLHEEMTLGGLHFRLTDTAGIRDTKEIVEREGIRRSKEAIERSDVIFLVIDASRSITSEDDRLLHSLPPSKTIVVWNKMDLPSACVHETPFSHSVQISAKTKVGLEDLKKAVDRLIWKEGAPSKDQVIISCLRHKQALLHAIENLSILIDGLASGQSPEFLTADIQSALRELGYIIGKDMKKEVLSSIFSQFCIGK